MATIDIFAEDCLTLAKAADLLPRGRGGKKTHVSTVWRWATKGVRGVHLETVRKGGILYTSRDALRGFFAALDGLPPPAPAEPTRRRQELDQMRRQLTDAGLKS